MSTCQTFQDRLSHHLLYSHTGERGSGARNKNAKPPHRYARSRAYRFAACAARKDVRVCRSSRGKFHTVAALLAHRDGLKERVSA